MASSGMNRRAVLGLAAKFGIALPVVGLAAACGEDDKSSAPGSAATVKRTYQTALGYNVGNAPEMVAREAGFFSKLGLDVNVISSTGTPQALQGVLAKTTHYSRVQSISIVTAVANENAPYVAFGTPVQRSAFEMQSLADKPIKSVAELAGKNLGVISAGGTTDVLITLMARKEGIDPASIKRKVVGLGVAAAEFAKRGEIVAWVGSAAERKALEAAGTPVSSFAFDDVVAVPADTYFTTKEEFSANREVVVKVLAAFYAGLEFVLDTANDKKTIEYIRNYNREIKPEEAQRQLDLVRPLYTATGKDKLMTVDKARWAELQESLLAEGVIKQKANLDDVVIDSLVAEAKAVKP
ncbi:ABC transporter substrate-binding protein [Dactylosporangium sucinum]|uniref:ABC transporter ATP-binding protein n=1 Tax=Dactylosporangium sucinum TaxID=1424081 RepID=A0A917TZC1_9ACTN|nr:ABC transporter substrate-binding protein [Dactylosporangium sucinum]GGM45943.1 ABC transporter ATP-binding protein [Dactylosporangium sucinum]